MEFVRGSSEWQLLVENNKIVKVNKNIHILVTDLLFMNLLIVLDFSTIILCQTNCFKNLISFSKNSLISLMPYFNIVILSTPIPKANPE